MLELRRIGIKSWQMSGHFLRRRKKRWNMIRNEEGDEEAHS